MTFNPENRVATGRKLWELLNVSERRKAAGLLLIMIIGMLLETLGIGLIIPTVGILTQPDYLDYLPGMARVLESLGNPSQEILVVGGMLALVSIYLVKGLFLAFLSWRQASFAFDLQARGPGRLFSGFLGPWRMKMQRMCSKPRRRTHKGLEPQDGIALQPGSRIPAT